MAHPISCKQGTDQPLDADRTVYLSSVGTPWDFENEATRFPVDGVPEFLGEGKPGETVGAVPGNRYATWFHALIEKAAQWIAKRRASELERYRDQDGHSYNSWL